MISLHIPAQLVDAMAIMSFQAICVAACYNVEWPLLIVCPSSVTITWLEALYTWLSPIVLPKPQDIHVITSGKVCVLTCATSDESAHHSLRMSLCRVYAWQAHACLWQSQVPSFFRSTDLRDTQVFLHN